MGRPCRRSTGCERPPVNGGVVRPFAAGDAAAVLALILSIQRGEFGLAVTADDQPDLADVPGFYQTGAGQFWVAEREGAVVGTIGLRDIGAQANGRPAVALRKMFVGPEARGALGVAGPLLATAIGHARARDVAEIYLGTTDRFLAAHRFYEKHGFARIAPEALPPAFPRMAVDSVFYRLTL
ncbi:GNAT family acetyltransferase [Caulobacter sp. Root487D2Y]|nr:GNAT family acetyltransferase [Caulobacter sp. Root487D2Y]